MKALGYSVLLLLVLGLCFPHVSVEALPSPANPFGHCSIYMTCNSSISQGQKAVCNLIASVNPTTAMVECTSYYGPETNYAQDNISVFINWFDGGPNYNNTVQEVTFTYNQFFSTLEMGGMLSISSPYYYFDGKPTVTVLNITTNYYGPTFYPSGLTDPAAINFQLNVNNVPTNLSNIDPPTFTVPLYGNLPNFNFSFYDPGIESIFYFEIIGMPNTPSFSANSVNFSTTSGYHNASLLDVFSPFFALNFPTFTQTGHYQLSLCVKDSETFAKKIFRAVPSFVYNCFPFTVYVVDVPARVIKVSSSPLVTMEGQIYPGGDSFCYFGPAYPTILVEFNGYQNSPAASFQEIINPTNALLNDQCFPLPASYYTFSDGPASFRPKFVIMSTDTFSPLAGESYTELRVLNTPPIATIISPASSSLSPISVQQGAPFNMQITVSISDASSVDSSAGFSVSYMLPTGKIVHVSGTFFGSSGFNPTIEFLFAGPSTIYVYATDKDGGVSAGAPIYFFAA